MADTVAEVKHQVGDDPDKARVALQQEREGENRPSLIKHLESVVHRHSDHSEETVAEDNGEHGAQAEPERNVGEDGTVRNEAGRTWEPQQEPTVHEPEDKVDEVSDPVGVGQSPTTLAQQIQSNEARDVARTDRQNAQDEQPTPNVVHPAVAIHPETGRMVQTKQIKTR